MKTLDQLDAAAHQAGAKAAAAQDAADGARALAETQRQERMAAFDRAQDAYDRVQLARDTAGAEQRLTAAVLAGPVWLAVIALGVAQRRQIHRWREAGSVGQSPLSSVEAIGFEQLARIADRAAANEMEDELDARARARIAAGESPACGQAERDTRLHG